MATARIRDLKVKIDKADKGHYYINVSQKDGKFKTTHVKLSGAEKMFSKDSDFVYVRPLRHAGNNKEVHAYLVGAGFDEAQVKKYMTDSYTANNFTKMINEYNREMARAPQPAPKAKQERIAVSMDYILSTSKALEGFKLEAKPKATTPTPHTPKPNAAGGKADLKTRLSSLGEEKVLDLSSFDAEKKVGIKTIKRPTVKSSKHAVGNTVDLKRIFYDFSKSVDAGIAALVFLGYNQEKATKIMRDPNHTKAADLSSVALKH
jgi:hypothetical protein